MPPDHQTVSPWFPSTGRKFSCLSSQPVPALWPLVPSVGTDIQLIDTCTGGTLDRWHLYDWGDGHSHWLLALPSWLSAFLYHLCLLPWITVNYIHAFFSYGKLFEERQMFRFGSSFNALNRGNSFRMSPQVKLSGHSVFHGTEKAEGVTHRWQRNAVHLPASFLPSTLRCPLKVSSFLIWGKNQQSSLVLICGEKKKRKLFKLCFSYHCHHTEPIQKAFEKSIFSLI